MARDVDSDRPELTSFAFGETEREETTVIELSLARTPRLVEEVAELRTLSGVLARELREEPRPRLREHQRRAILEARRVALMARAAPPVVPSGEMPRGGRGVEVRVPRLPVSGAEDRFNEERDLAAAYGSVWERLEPVLVAIALLLLGLLEPRLYRLFHAGLLLWRERFTPEAAADSPIEPVELAQRFFFRTVALSAVIALTYYGALRGTVYRRRETPTWQVLLIFGTFIAAQVLLLPDVSRLPE